MRIKTLFMHTPQKSPLRLLGLLAISAVLLGGNAFAGNISERREASKSPTLICVVAVPVKKADSGKDAPISCHPQASTDKPEQARPSKQ
jgi:hypothetical protein